MTNPGCKAFAKMVNARENQHILDISLYNAAQPHYIANPILGNGVETDPLPVRLMLDGENEAWDMQANAERPDTRSVSGGSRYPPV